MVEKEAVEMEVAGAHENARGHSGCAPRSGGAGLQGSLGTDNAHHYVCWMHPPRSFLPPRPIRVSCRHERVDGVQPRLHGLARSKEVESWCFVPGLAVSSHRGQRQNIPETTS